MDPYLEPTTTPPDSEQVVTEDGKPIYDQYGRVRMSYRGKLGWAYLTHLELDEDA